MARPLRVHIENGWYHVTARGIDRGIIYQDTRDQVHFLELMEEVVERFRIVIHAYVQMDNHYHLVLQTPEANLSETMQWLNMSYSLWYNRRHDRVGPLFQGRFKAIPVENEAWGDSLSQYVHLNPIRIKRLGFGRGERRQANEGRLAPPSQEEVGRCLEKLRTYRWSSYRAYAGYERKKKWLETGVLLSRRKRVRDRAKQQEQYRKEMEGLARQGGEAPWVEQVKNGFSVGSALFTERVKRLVKPGHEEVGKGVVRQRCRFEDIVAGAESLASDKWERMKSRHGDWWKWLVMRTARRYAGMTLAEIGEQAGGMDYAAVSIGLKRFEIRLAHDKTIEKAGQKLVELLNVET